MAAIFSPTDRPPCPAKVQKIRKRSERKVKELQQRKKARTAKKAKAESGMRVVRCAVLPVSPEAIWREDGLILSHLLKVCS